MAPEGAQRLAAVLDWTRCPAVGEQLPPLWHWAYFPDLTAQSGLAVDGHTRNADGPFQRLPRRMLASGHVQWLEPCRIGTRAERRSEYNGFTEKQGRSGSLTFVEWRHEIHQRERPVIVEYQTVVYRCNDRNARPSAVAPSSGLPADDGLAFKRTLRFDPVLLFRYSAVTWNAHRIHYDAGYAAEEGYPGLVVHGPLLATFLAYEALGELGELKEVNFRAVVPVFVDDLIEVYCRSSGGLCTVEARHRDGTVAMSLSASARDSQPNELSSVKV